VKTGFLPSVTGNQPCYTDNTVGIQVIANIHAYCPHIREANEILIYPQKFKGMDGWISTKQTLDPPLPQIFCLRRPHINPLSPR
jgi:hypothetical protein